MIPLLFVILFSLALFHWAYEFAIAPSWRLGIRYKLFALRDELRNFATQRGIQLDKQAIETLEDVLNSAIHNMREINFGFVLAFSSRYRSDESFRKRMDHRRSVVEGYQDPDFRSICHRYQHLFREINVANSGGWFVYLVPLVYMAVCWKWLRRFWKVISLVPSAEYPTLSRETSEVFAEPA
jgi:hypothetical protein